VIENDDLRRQFGGAARRVAEGFEWRHVATRYVDHFRAAVKTE